MLASRKGDLQAQWAGSLASNFLWPLSQASAPCQGSAAERQEDQQGNVLLRQGRRSIVAGAGAERREIQTSLDALCVGED
jgi:hypothetical protein